MMIRWLKGATVLLLIHYVAIALFIGLAHAHEPDVDFHDDCPACQWVMQTHDSDYVNMAGLHSILYPNFPVRGYIAIDDFQFSSQIGFPHQFSRAPPALSCT